MSLTGTRSTGSYFQLLLFSDAIYNFLQPSKLCLLSAVRYFHTVICLKKSAPSLTHPHPSSNSPVEPAVPETTRSYFLSFKLPLSGKPHPLRCAAGHTYECVRGKGVCSPKDKVELANKLFPHLTWHTPERDDVCVLMHEQAYFLEAINRTGRTCKIGLRAPTQAHTNTESWFRERGLEHITHTQLLFPMAGRLMTLLLTRAGYFDRTNSCPMSRRELSWSYKRTHVTAFSVRSVSQLTSQITAGACAVCIPPVGISSRL